MDQRSGFTEPASTLELDACREPWPVTQAVGAFSANTTHIMHWPAVEGLFRGIGRMLQPGGAFCLYGPFNYNGRYTSASNAQFDAMLKQRDPASGIRDFADLDRLARDNGLRFSRIIRCRRTTVPWSGCGIANNTLEDLLYGPNRH